MISNTRHFRTPMMQQYEKIKVKYPDCLLFFRLGDFYELFLEDAETGSKILDITLTARHKGADGKIPMCGIPYHALDNYLPKIVKAGFKAAICEQLGTDKGEDKIVEREVVRVITSGTLVDEKVLNNKSNNFLALLTINNSTYQAIIVYTDLSTGQFNYKQIETKTNFTENFYETIKTELFKINPAEIILPSKIYENYEILKILNQIGRVNISRVTNEITDYDESLNTIYNYFRIKSISIFNINEKNELGIISIANLLNYLFYTQKGNLFHIKEIKNISNSKALKLDIDTIKNLEIFESNSSSFKQNKGLSLYETLDLTLTPMGARLLRERIINPFIDSLEINKRLDVLEKITEDHKLRDSLRDTLKNIKDLERILARIGTKSCNSRDLKYLGDNLYVASFLLSFALSREKSDLITITECNHAQSSDLIEALSKLITKINLTLVDDPPISVREGGMIRDGVNNDLDRIKTSIEDSRLWIAGLETIEREKTGINSLKISFNSVYGYYIEVSKANQKKIPATYIRKQTLVNAERYITQELKEKEDIVLTAKEKTDEIEYKIFNELVDETLSYVEEIQKIAKIVAEFDLISTLAQLAVQDNYVKPKIDYNFDLIIKEGRHPVVERVVLTQNLPFTPNNTTLNKGKFFQLITGPNMAGKSTYIRQTAIIQIMAQLASFIPAQEASLSIVDGIYTRIGSGDALSLGLSTFMVEMIETAKILHNSTSLSLVILDEVGRGTSTIDGLCIARAIAEYIHNEIGCKTLFATHFHELITLEQRLKHLENFNVKVIERDGEIKFLHKVERGSTNKSYGIEVAKLAGIPNKVIDRAKELLNKTDQKQIKFDL